MRSARSSPGSRRPARHTLAWLSLPLLTVVFSIGGAAATTRAKIEAKMDTTAFALYRERHQMRDTLLLETVAAIREDVRVLVCERYARQPRCLGRGGTAR